MDGQFWYVHMLQSIDSTGHWYVGMTEDLAQRLKSHNAGKVPHTAKIQSAARPCSRGLDTRTSWQVVFRLPLYQTRP